jgi:ribosome biogenesis GTPase
VIANKSDLVRPDEAIALFHLYEEIGYRVLHVSAQSGEGLAALRDQLAGRMSMFAGRSGVGKSSLLNAMQPGLSLRVGEVSEAVGKGRHTTVVAELHPLVGGGYVADTPGIRELAGWRIPDDELAWCFRELRPFLGQCDFNDCTHTREPGCAVRAAVEEQRIAAERYDSYVRQLLKENSRA